MPTTFAARHGQQSHERAHLAVRDLSVVVASVEAARSIEPCLRSLERSCAGLNSELIVVDASNDDTAVRVGQLDVPARLFRYPTGALTPELWAEGYRCSSGRIVAFMTGHSVVSPGWARALVNAIDGGATGAGGPLVIADGNRPIDWAVFYLRYSAFMPGTLGSGRVTGEIAGDNAAYRRDALDRHAASLKSGFWEKDFHQLVRRDGGWLAAVPEALMAFGPSFPMATIVRHRFAHGRYFGAGRAATRATWPLVLAAPLVPFLLAARAASRVLHTRTGFWRFVVAAPWFLALAGAWAAGEAWGALTGAPVAGSCPEPGCQ